LQTKSRTQIGRVVRAFGFHRLRARSHVHSPDPAYDSKRTAIQTAAQAPHAALWYLDEVTIYRQPTLAQAYAPVGAQPLAERSHRSDTALRVIAALNAATGQVVWQRASAITVEQQVSFYQYLVEVTGGGPLQIVLDNWPPHFHPNLLVALDSQHTPFPFPRPRWWATTPRTAASERWGTLHLPIQFLPLPTYASWLNPIEKLWRWLRQDVTHLHPWANQLRELGSAVDAFLECFDGPSPELLHYVGLLPDY
jgi:transposase